MTIAYQPISLGSTCEAKFQICRKLYQTYYGKKSEAGFRMQMMPPERGERQYGWHALDWQRTPFSALLTYLESDFDRVFERQDLYVDGEFVMHRTNGTEHSHQFPSHSENWTEADLDRIHPIAQRRMEKRAADWRRLQNEPGPFLYVWTANTAYAGLDRLPPPDQVARLLDLLSVGGADHRFHLLMVGNPGKDQDYSAFGDRVTKAYRREEVRKTTTMKWEGDDEGWNEILQPFSLTLHGPAAAPVTMDQVSTDLSAQVISSPEPRSLFSRLLGR